ncbi:MAG: hypothetical protein ACFB51_19810, partial [Anaerolineae bacterium]
MFASGVETLWVYYAVVVSFVGLQYVAYRIVDDLARAKAPIVRRLAGGRSLGQWVNWVRGVKP